MMTGFRKAMRTGNRSVIVTNNKGAYMVSYERDGEYFYVSLMRDDGTIIASGTCDKYDL